MRISRELPAVLPRWSSRLSLVCNSKLAVVEPKSTSSEQQPASETGKELRVSGTLADRSEMQPLLEIDPEKNACSSNPTPELSGGAGAIANLLTRFNRAEQLSEGAAHAETKAELQQQPQHAAPSVSPLQSPVSEVTPLALMPYSPAARSADETPPGLVNTTTRRVLCSEFEQLCVTIKPSTSKSGTGRVGSGCDSPVQTSATPLLSKFVQEDMPASAGGDYDSPELVPWCQGKGCGRPAEIESVQEVDAKNPSAKPPPNVPIPQPVPTKPPPNVPISQPVPTKPPGAARRHTVPVDAKKVPAKFTACIRNARQLPAPGVKPKAPTSAGLSKARQTSALPTSKTLPQTRATVKPRRTSALPATNVLPQPGANGIKKVRPAAAVKPGGATQKPVVAFGASRASSSAVPPKKNAAQQEASKKGPQPGGALCSAKRVVKAAVAVGPPKRKLQDTVPVGARRPAKPVHAGKLLSTKPGSSSLVACTAAPALAASCGKAPAPIVGQVEVPTSTCQTEQKVNSLAASPGSQQDAADTVYGSAALAPSELGTTAEVFHGKGAAVADMHSPVLEFQAVITPASDPNALATDSQVSDTPASQIDLTSSKSITALTELPAESVFASDSVQDASRDGASPMFLQSSKLEEQDDRVVGSSLIEELQTTLQQVHHEGEMEASMLVPEYADIEMLSEEETGTAMLVPEHVDTETTYDQPAFTAPLLNPTINQAPRPSISPDHSVPASNTVLDHEVASIAQVQQSSTSGNYEECAAMITTLGGTGVTKKTEPAAFDFQDSKLVPSHTFPAWNKNIAALPPAPSIRLSSGTSERISDHGGQLPLSAASQQHAGTAAKAQGGLVDLFMGTMKINTEERRASFCFPTMAPVQSRSVDAPFFGFKSSVSADTPTLFTGTQRADVWSSSSGVENQSEQTFAPADMPSRLSMVDLANLPGPLCTADDAVQDIPGDATSPMSVDVQSITLNLSPDGTITTGSTAASTRSRTVPVSATKVNIAAPDSSPTPLKAMSLNTTAPCATFNSAGVKGLGLLEPYPSPTPMRGMRVEVPPPCPTPTPRKAMRVPIHTPLSSGFRAQRVPVERSSAKRVPTNAPGIRSKGQHEVKMSDLDENTASAGTHQILALTRSSKKQQEELGAGKVILTPVRRSTRKGQPASGSVESLLKATNFCYSPNATLRMDR